MNRLLFHDPLLEAVKLNLCAVFRATHDGRLTASLKNQPTTGSTFAPVTGSFIGRASDVNAR